MYELAPVEQKLTHDSTVIPVGLVYEADESVRPPTLSLSRDMVSYTGQKHWVTYVQHPYAVQPTGSVRRYA
jgi:hypothetical protein